MKKIANSDRIEKNDKKERKVKEGDDQTKHDEEPKNTLKTKQNIFFLKSPNCFQENQWHQ